VAALRALSDENRVRIALALGRQPLCVCQIVELVQLANSTVSDHLTILKVAGLATAHKEGRWVYYRTADKRADCAIGEVLAFVFKALEHDQQIRADVKQLANILQIDPGELCRRQKSRGGNGCGRHVSTVR
jgi:DNA-binding transcriptional ArsR family regulator